MKVLRILGFVIASGVISEAALVTWQGGPGNWTNANWAVDGINEQSIGTTISDQISITNGSVSVSGNLIAATGGSVADQSLHISNSAQLTVGGIIDFGSGNNNTQTLGFRMEDGALVSASYLQLKTKNLARTNIEFGGGVLTLTSDNSIRGGDFPNQNVNITAGAGEFSIIATATPQVGKSLATKVGSDLFAIDGTKIVVVADGSEISILNAELVTKVVNGKWLKITGTNDGPQTLEVIPEPAVIGLISIAGCGFLVIRRFTAG
ncbi:hypothetical protein PDESU_04931 [Pontiella desulfatans]|uniref:PEP-CTERM protein-sorting domain-containing protein n=1 Tax=Pontiella desulfatans TaxID=2750659 RepID=A0A6C2U8F9_PONDE|nr:PEP-CTERM sorting domain-containing protein [Pontiella desulfatans]VGO16340.1 hypothetical protein PDESU_04931 [Pontiella desulfatans]